MPPTSHDHPASTPYGGSRMTAPRRAIVHAIAHRREAFTPEDLIAEIRLPDGTRVSTATVYRALAMMESGGYIERLGTRAQSALYARCDRDAHHHHIVCDGCGLTVEADCPLQADMTEKDGFVITRHEVTLYGLCPACARHEKDA